MIEFSDFSIWHYNEEAGSQKVVKNLFWRQPGRSERIFLKYFEKTLQNLLTFYSQKTIIYT